MLVLSRQEGESIIIADEIVVTIISFDGKVAKIGIKAPPSVRIDRSEVHARRRDERDERDVPANPLIEPKSTLPSACA